MTRTAAPARRSLIRAAAAVTALGGLALTGVVAGPTANATPTARPTRDVVQQHINRLVQEHGFPAVLASVREPNGRTRDYAAGVADVRTRAKAPVDGRVRIASNTKMFTATVVLQLVGEGKIELDESVETYLPGVVRGDGIDARQITVRQLLQQTSGLADYDQVLFEENFVEALRTYHEPHDLIAVALAQKPTSGPGEKFAYTNTNYVLAGLIVQKVTGRPIGEQITKRIINRLGLRDTYWPADGETTIRGRHPRGYFPPVDGDPQVDVTESETSAGWAAGALVGSPSDLNRFMAALIGGKLLKPAQLRQMQQTVDADGFDTVGGSRYGLGLATFTLSCGGFAWTHGGTAPGYVTANAVKADGKAATIAVTTMMTSTEAAQDVEATLDTALCR